MQSGMVAGATDARNLQTLAQQLGYPYVEIAPGGPFGTLSNALLSEFPITRSTVWTAALLSGDAKANDLTRFLPEIRVDVTGRGDLLGLVSAHLKTACTLAADHLPVLADLIVPTAVVAETLRISDAARTEGPDGHQPLDLYTDPQPQERRAGDGALRHRQWLRPGRHGLHRRQRPGDLCAGPDQQDAGHWREGRHGAGG